MGHYYITDDHILKKRGNTGNPERERENAEYLGYFKMKKRNILVLIKGRASI